MSNAMTDAIKAPISNSLSPEPCALIPGSEELFQDQSCYLTVGALCSCDADAHPAVSYALFGLEPIA